MNAFSLRCEQCAARRSRAGELRRRTAARLRTERRKGAACRRTSVGSAKCASATRPGHGCVDCVGCYMPSIRGLAPRAKLWASQKIASAASGQKIAHQLQRSLGGRPPHLEASTPRARPSAARSSSPPARSTVRRNCAGSTPPTRQPQSRQAWTLSGTRGMPPLNFHQRSPRGRNRTSPSPSIVPPTVRALPQRTHGDVETCASRLSSSTR